MSAGIHTETVGAMEVACRCFIGVDHTREQYDAFYEEQNRRRKAAFEQLRAFDEKYDAAGDRRWDWPSFGAGASIGGGIVFITISVINLIGWFL